MHQYRPGARGLLTVLLCFAAVGAMNAQGLSETPAERDARM